MIKWIKTKEEFPKEKEVVIGIFLLDNDDFNFRKIYWHYIFGSPKDEIIWKNAVLPIYRENEPDYWMEISYELVKYFQPKNNVKTQINRFEFMEII